MAIIELHALPLMCHISNPRPSVRVEQSVPPTDLGRFPLPQLEDALLLDADLEPSFISIVLKKKFFLMFRLIF